MRPERFRHPATTCSLLLAFSVAAMGLSTLAWSQDDLKRERQVNRKQMRERRLQQRQVEDESMRETFMLLFLDGLRKRLELSNEQTLELLPLFETLEQVRSDHMAQRKQAMQSLLSLVGDPEAKDADIALGLKTLDSEEKRFRTDEEKLTESINAKLSVRQQAQLVFFQARFQERLRHLVQKRRMEGGGEGFHGPPEGEMRGRRWMEGKEPRPKGLPNDR